MNAIVSLVGDARVCKWAMELMIKDTNDGCVEGPTATGNIRPVWAIASEFLFPNGHYSALMTITETANFPFGFGPTYRSTRCGYGLSTTGSGQSFRSFAKLNVRDIEE